LLKAFVVATMPLVSSAAFADPLRTVTSGLVFQIPEDGETGLSLSGDGFVFHSEVLFRPADICDPCMGGSRFDLSSVASLRVFPASTASIDGHSYDPVFLTGDLDFMAGSVTVPDVAVGALDVARETPFTMSGSITGYANSTLTGSALFTVPLTGRGIARIRFFNFEASPGIHPDGAEFEFTTAAATPEPASLALLATGAAWIGRRRQRGLPR
jgi:hypothetical protein